MKDYFQGLGSWIPWILWTRELLFCDGHRNPFFDTYGSFLFNKSKFQKDISRILLWEKPTSMWQRIYTCTHTHRFTAEPRRSIQMTDAPCTESVIFCVCYMKMLKWGCLTRSTQPLSQMILLLYMYSQERIGILLTFLPALKHNTTVPPFTAAVKRQTRE